MPQSQSLQVAIAQMTSTDQMQDNLKAILAMVEDAANRGARVILFPENSVFMRLEPGSKLQTFEPSGADGLQLQELATRNQIHILLTTPAPVGEGEKSVNATLHWAPGQAGRVVYSKIHLFDVEVDGAPAVRESDHFWPGEKPAVLTIDDWRFGLSICYDLRFAELFTAYQGRVDAILVPSAFLVPTGQAHWHVLLRARAIENQCYVLAPAQTGEHRSTTGVVRKTYGHSLAVDPWGRIELDNDQGPGIRLVELKREKLSWVRQQIPMHAHRRLKSI